MAQRSDGVIIEERNCDKCCVPLNTVKARLRIFTWLCTSMMVFVIGGNLWFLKANADPGHQVTEAKIEKDVQRNTEQIKEVKEAHTGLTKKVDDVSERLKNVEIMQMKSLTILERLENK